MKGHFERKLLLFELCPIGSPLGSTGPLRDLLVYLGPLFLKIGSPFPLNWVLLWSPWGKMGHSVVLAFLRKVFFFSRSPEDAAVILLKKLLEAAHIQVSRNCMNLI